MLKYVKDATEEEKRGVEDALAELPTKIPLIR